MRTFLICKYLNFLGSHVGALFGTNFGCASSEMGTELGAQVVKEAHNQVSNLHFLGALSQLCNKDRRIRRVSEAIVSVWLSVYGYD